MRKIRPIFIVGIVLTLILLLAACAGENEVPVAESPPATEPILTSEIPVDPEPTNDDDDVSEAEPPQPAGPVSFGDTFQFNGSSGRIELTFGTSVYWGAVTNSWSEHYGTSVFAIPVTIRNVSSETGGLNPFDFTAFGSDGLRLDSVGAGFDYDIAWESNMRAGASQTGLFHFLFNGDGEYVIEFSAGFGFGDSQEVIFDIVYASAPSLSEFDINAFPPSTFSPLPMGNALTLGDTFEFRSSSGEVEITFGTSVSWLTIDNTWSQHHGAVVFSIPISITNIGTETGGLNPFDFNLFGSNGLRLGSVGTLDGDITWEGNMRPGAIQEGYLHFLYVGDGQYAIEFAAGLGFGDSQEVMFNIIE